MIRQTLTAEKTKIITPTNVFIGTYAAVGLTVVVAALLMAYSTGFAALSLLTVNQTYGSENEMKVDSLALDKYEKIIYRFSLNASVNLKTDDALVRFVLVDNNNKEYLVYETDSAISGQTSFPATIVVTDSNCEETCVLPGIQVSSLKIHTKNASVIIGGINYLDRADATKSFQVNSRTEIVNRKIASINAKNLSWKAGHTSVSDLSYADKKKLFVKPDGTPVDELPDLQGLEYYKGGIFVVNGGVSPEKSSMPSSNIVVPEYFDWRNAHGENWMTSVKNQGQVGTCFIYSIVGSYEAIINLYYNRHLNIDLSEQMYIDCRTYDESLGIPRAVSNPITDLSTFSECIFKGALCNVRKWGGLADEACDPYVSRDYDRGKNSNCSVKNICGNWKDRLWNHSDSIEYDLRDLGAISKNTIQDVNTYKSFLIKNGPIQGAYAPWNHAMTLVGYGIIKVGINVANPAFEQSNTTVPVPENSPLIGQTYWIFKNSWGANWGDRGYGKFVVDFVNDGIRSEIMKGPITPPNDKIYWPTGFDGKTLCVDKDQDGYCNWGIADQPPTGSICPNDRTLRTTCKKNSAGLLVKDCNDSDAKLGPFISENNFNCSSNLISTIYSVKDSLSCASNGGVELSRLNTPGVIYKLCKTPSDLPVSMVENMADCPVSQSKIAGVFQTPNNSNWKLCYDDSQILIRAVANSGSCQSGEYNVGVFKGRDGLGSWRLCYKRYTSRIVPN